MAPRPRPEIGSIAVVLRSTWDGTRVVAYGTSPPLLIDASTGAVRAAITVGLPVVDEGEPRPEVGRGADRREAHLDGTPLPSAPCPRPTTLVVEWVVVVCTEDDGSRATVDGGPPIRLGHVAVGGHGLDEGSSRSVRVVPVPGAVVVASTSSGPTLVQGLSSW